MGKSLEEKEISEIAWPLLFLVTGGSLVLFSFAMKFLDGKQPKLMLWGGLLSLLLSLIIFLGTRPLGSSSSESEAD
jgi:hypothetical protein